MTHHHHSVGNFSDHAHVMRNKNNAHVHFFLQLANQLQNLRLNRHVKGRGRLIGNQERRLTR